MPTVHESAPLALAATANTRLLKLELNPSQKPSESLISVRLHSTSLQDSPPYTAVSYVWGDPSPTKTILLHGQLFTVRQNLWDLLAQLQRVQYSDYLWIDDLCIDQTNISERSHQVSIMGSIYTQAAKTIVWLGAATEETAKDMQDITKIFGEKDYTARERYVGLYDELFSRPYWRRMWIQQEYSLSSNISIWCGEGALEPAVWYGLYKLLNGSGIGTNGGWGSIQFVQLHNLRYSVGINHRGSSLAAKLGITVILQCADPRDRVYALFSVLSTQEREAWGIDRVRNKQAIGRLITGLGLSRTR